MKKVIFFIVVVLIFGLFSKTTLAAPAPWGLAVNGETQECAGYWGGDEFINYELPEGWQSYYTDEYTIITAGTPEEYCEFNTYDNNIGSCCEQLGYEYIKNPLPTKILEDGTRTLYKCYKYKGKGAVNFFYDKDSFDPADCESLEIEEYDYKSSCKYDFLGVQINSAGKCKEYYEGWVNIQSEYHSPPYLKQYSLIQCGLDDWNEWFPIKNKEEVYKLKTPYGECDFERYNEEMCCENLGLKYVAHNIGSKKSSMIVEGIEKATPVISIVFYNDYTTLATGLIILLLLYLIIRYRVVKLIRKKQDSISVDSSEQDKDLN